MLVAANLVPLIHWLNLARYDVSWRLPVCAAVAGVLTGSMRRDGARATAIGGAIAALLSLWVVYGARRLSVPVLWVERSAVRVIVADLVRLALYAVPSGAATAWVTHRVRARRSH